MVVTDALTAVSRLCFDTGPVIYRVEKVAPFHHICDPFFDAIAVGLPAVTSEATFSETLVKPIRDGNTALIAAYRSLFFASANVSLVPATLPLWERAAELRAKYLSLRLPDALHLATAIETGCDGFLTSDKGLRSVTEVPVFYIGDLTL